MEVPRSGRRLKKLMLEVVDNQMRSEDPPETKETYERLRSEGFSARRAKELLGAVVASEIFDVMKEGREFDRSSFVAALRELPNLE